MPAESPRISIRLPLSIFAAVSLSQCATKPAAPVGPPDDTFWSEAPVSGPAKVVISLDEQRVGLFKGDQLVGLSPISSGKEGNDTRPGMYKVTEKDEDHRSSWYGGFVDDAGNLVVEDVDVRKDTPPPGTKFMGASMNWFMRFNGAIGMHQGYLPGYPASHGCIRLPEKMAVLFYSATDHGTTVEVKKNADLIAQRPGHAAPVSSPVAPVVVPPGQPAPAPVTTTVAGTTLFAPSTAPAPRLSRLSRLLRPAAAAAPRPAVAAAPAPSAAPRPARTPVDAALLRHMPPRSGALRPTTPFVPGIPTAPMTLAPASKSPKKALGTPTMYLPGYGP